MPRRRIAVDLAEHKAWQADVDAFGLAVEFFKVEMDQCPDATRMLRIVLQGFDCVISTGSPSSSNVSMWLVMAARTLLSASSTLSPHEWTPWMSGTFTPYTLAASLKMTMGIYMAAPCD